MILSKYVQSDLEGSFENPIHDEFTSKKIHQHLSNQHDVISEQDIEKVRTDFDKVSAVINPVNVTIDRIVSITDEDKPEPVAQSSWDTIKK